MKYSKANSLFLIIAALTLIFGFFAPEILPDRYLFDAYRIYNDPFNQKGLIGSYPFTMWFYHFSGLNKISFSIISVIQISTILFFFYKQGIPYKFHKLYLSNIIILASFIAVSVYLSIPSKEFINIIFIFFIVYVLRLKLKSNNIKMFLVFFILLVFGLWFRQYYILVPIFAVASFIASKIKTENKIASIIITTFLLAFFLSASHGFIKGEFMSESTREALNKKRIKDPNSKTLILSPIKTNSILGETIGILNGYFSVNIPFQSFKFYNKPQVILFTVWQLLLFVILIQNYSRCLMSKEPIDQNKVWLFHILFGYFMVQGIFEPDLGSSIKHKIGVLPLIYEAVFYKRLN